MLWLALSVTRLPFGLSLRLALSVTIWLFSSKLMPKPSYFIRVSSSLARTLGFYELAVI